MKKTLKDSAAIRWLALILISALTFSTYWFQDFFGGLKPLMESKMGFTSEEFGRLIGLTTIANMFGMIIIGGMILDKWGIRIAGILFGGLATLGGAISALASTGFFGESHSATLSFMIVGRILFGVGLEVTCVVATRTVVKWFKGYELALAMAINMGFGRLGSAMGIAVSPDLAVKTVPPAVVFAATLIGIALILFVIYIFFDIKIDKQVKEAAEGSDEDEFKFSDLFKLLQNKSFIYIALLCVAFYAAVFPFIQYAADLLVNKFGFTSTLPDGEGVVVLFGSNALGTVIIYLALFIFALSFTLIPAQLKAKGAKLFSLIIILALFGFFIHSFKDVFSVWFKNGPKTASLIPLGTILFTPIFGNIVDKKGKAASLMMLGSLLLIFAHLSLSVFNSVLLGYAGLLSLGIAFSLVPAAMWPSVAKIVPESRLGTAYASMFTVQNWGLGAFFWGIGAVLDLTNKENLEAIRAGNEVYNYTVPILLLVGCGVISIFLSYKLKQADKKQKFGLEMPSGQKPE
ncbi:MAG: MFS transporter [Prolixibacteraceae bacterium]|nr:MFS transporter [Prolixibacteraceae bacterium]